MSYLNAARVYAVISPVTALILILALRILDPNDRVIPGILLYLLGVIFVLSMQVISDSRHDTTGER